MSYQKCPVCQGVGEVLCTDSTSCMRRCMTCGGSGIIDEFTGLPPHSFNKEDKEVDNEIKKVLEDDINEQLS